MMTNGKFRHLPVTDRGKMVAMLSIWDIPTTHRWMYERYVERLSTKTTH